MKKHFYYSLSFCLSLLAIVQMGVAQSPEAVLPLPGHLQTEANALKNSSNVIVATFLYVKSTAPGPPGVNRCEVIIQVNSQLVGEVKGQLDCAFDYFTFPSEAERVPSAGVQYIVFVEKGRAIYGFAQHKISKFVVYSDDKLAQVKKQIDEAKGPINKEAR